MREQFRDWKNGVKVRSWVFQSIFLLGILAFLFFVMANVREYYTQKNIASGFSFLNQEAGFEIGESLFSFHPRDSYLKAIWIGILNTLKVSLFGNCLALIMAVCVGLGALSSNWPLKALSRSYIELLRNIPLLLQLFFWYALLTEYLPSVRSAYQLLPHVYLTNRGVFFPSINFSNMLVSFPTLEGFNFVGGLSLSPEYLSLLLGLVLYTSAFMAEIIRSGILSISKGQWEASSSLGMNYFQSFFYVIFPQSLRVAFPPLISQILNLTKNSSLAVAIGFPDFVSVANTVMNQTGQAIELVFIIIMVYLFMSLFTSFIMNTYYARLARRERL